MTPRVLLATRNEKKLVELRRILSPLVDVEVVGLGDLAGEHRSDEGARSGARRQFAATDEVPETGATFAENALIKARDAYRHTGLLTVADDSGLCVDALNGMPGVLSARWAGSTKDDDANVRLVLEQLADVPDQRLGAHFECAVAVLAPKRGDRREQTELQTAEFQTAELQTTESHGIEAHRIEAHRIEAQSQPAAEQVVHGRMSGHIVRTPRGAGGFGYDPIFVADGHHRTSAELSAQEKDAVSHRGKALRALAPVLVALLSG